MFGENIKVYIIDQMTSYHTEIWVIETEGMKQFSVSYSDGQMTRTEIEEGSHLDRRLYTPLLIMNSINKHTQTNITT